jgi:hypothetical protein
MEDDEISAYDQVRLLYERRFGDAKVTPAEYEDPPFSRGRIAAFIEDGNQLDSVKWVVKWQMGWNASHFTRALEQVIIYADDDHLMRLALGYPHEVMGFLAYRLGKLADDLENSGIIHKGH